MNLNFNSIFNNLELNCECPGCNSNILFKLSDSSDAVNCSECGVKIQFNKSDEFQNSINSINKLLSDC